MPTANEEMQSYCRAIEASHAKDIQHLETRIVELEKLMDARFAAQQTAVEKAADTLTARLEQVNEFRAQMADQAARFVTRDVVDATTNELARRVGSLESRLAGYDGRIIGWSAGSGAIVLIIAIVAQLLDLGG